MKKSHHLTSPKNQKNNKVYKCDIRKINNMYHNMSVPPTSKVYVNKEQLTNYYCFNPLTLAELLNCKYEELNKKVEEYCIKNKNITSYIKKPTGYMIGEIKKISLSLSETTVLKNFKYDKCNDIELLILIFCGTVGDLYIPNRSLSFEQYKFENYVLFPKNEVDS